MRIALIGVGMIGGSLLAAWRQAGLVTTASGYDIDARAVAALADEAFVERSVEVNRRGMAQVTAAFDGLGLRYLPSHGNFVLVHVGDGAAVYQGLLKRGVIVRPVANYGLPQWLRVTIGLPEENDRFIVALREVLRGDRA